MAQTYDYRRHVVAKTANYTITVGDSGKIFTNAGATGAVTFTLPAASSTYAGYEVEFQVEADQNLILAGTAGELVTFNDAAANSVAYQTTSEKIGGCFVARMNAANTKWLIKICAEETQTVVVST